MLSVQTVCGVWAFPVLALLTSVLLYLSRRTSRELTDIPGTLRGASKRQLLQVSFHVRMSWDVCAH